jgi:hypothetical protein
MTTSALQLGFIGLGIMGAPMCGHLAAAGHSVRVHVRRGIPDSLAGAGLQRCGSAREVAEQSDVIFTMLPDTPDVQSVLEATQPRELLPGGRLGPSLHHALVALVECVLEVQQRAHQPQRQARTAGRRHARPCYLGHAAEEVHIRDVFTSTNLLGKQVRDVGFELLPRQPGGQHRQRVAQLDHLVESAAEEIGRVAHRAYLPKTPRKRGYPG